jgi:hypothetical protein
LAYRPNLCICNPNLSNPWWASFFSSRNEASLGERIEQAWGQENTKGDLGVIHHALKNTLQSLKQWSMAHFSSVRKEIERLRELLAEQQADGTDEAAIKDTIRNMNGILYREEMIHSAIWSEQGVA